MAQDWLTWQATAAANLREARRKNGRLGSKKSRSGCLTCKTRRVKCDEVKPECDRCRSTGRKCDGYSGSQKSDKTNNSLIRSQFSQSLGLRDGDRRRFDFFLSWTAPRLAGSLDKEFWCGHVLRLAHAEPLVLDSLLAISTLYEHPQYLVSFHPPTNVSPRSGKIAALQMAHPSHPQPPDEHHTSALRLYNRAIRSVKQRMEDGTGTPLIALLSCVLFICIEVIRDNVFGALSLFTRGSGLLREFGAQIEADEKGNGLLTLIKSMFSRLGILAATFGHPRPMEFPLELVANGEYDAFSNMTEARAALFALISSSHAFFQDCNTWNESLMLALNEDGARESPFTISEPDLTLPAVFDTKFSEIPKPSTGSELLLATTCPKVDEKLDMFELGGYVENAADGLADLFEQQRLRDQMDSLSTGKTAEFQEFGNLPERQRELQKRLSQWFDAFQGELIPDRTNRNKRDQIDCPTILHLERHYRANLQRFPVPIRQTAQTEPETASYLLMYYHTASVWLSTRLNPIQMAFDEQKYHFEELVRHAEVYVKAKAIEKPTFTFEVGAVPPLYFTATKCRIPSLRRRALDLITRAPRKECMWGAESTAELVARLIAIEEAELGLPVPDCSGWCATVANIDDSISPLEEMRVHNVELLKNKSTGTFEVRITRYAEVNGRLRKRVEEVPI